VRVTSGVHSPSDLGHPEFDAVVNEHREREAELLTVERAGWFPNDHGLEPALMVSESVQK
jgi:hypothetical protein